MHRKLLTVVLIVAAVPGLSFAEGPRSAEIPPDYGPVRPPPRPADGEPASGWVFLSHPHHYRTPLYYLCDGQTEGPTATILVSRQGALSARQTFDRAPRLMLHISGSPAGQTVSVASGDVVPVSGRLVRFERAEFPADYPQASIPRHVMDRGLRWTDVTDAVPAELRPGQGWPLVLAPTAPENRHRFKYKLFPDPDQRKPEVHKRPYYVRVAKIAARAGAGEPTQAEIEIIEKTRLRETTVRTLSVQPGQSIAHDDRAHRVVKIVPPQKIDGIGNLVGWVEVEL